MRPYLVLMAVVLMAVAAFGQQPPTPHPTYNGCLYGCGPYVPLVSTPMVSLQTVSPNPVGASNATTGLVAGATNGTLSQIQGTTRSGKNIRAKSMGHAEKRALAGRITRDESTPRTQV